MPSSIEPSISSSICGTSSRTRGALRCERALVADLRRTSADLREDAVFIAFVDELRTRSPRFARMWDEARAAPHRSLVKTVRGRLVGDITLDCDVLTVPDSDIELVVYSTAERGPDADKLDFLRVGAVPTAV